MSTTSPTGYWTDSTTSPTGKIISGQFISGTPPQSYIDKMNETFKGTTYTGPAVTTSNFNDPNLGVQTSVGGGVLPSKTGGGLTPEVKTTTPVTTSNQAQLDYQSKLDNYNKLVRDIENQTLKLTQQQADRLSMQSQADLQNAKQKLDQQNVDIKKSEVDAKNRALGLATAPTGEQSVSIQNQNQGVVTGGVTSAMPTPATTTPTGSTSPVAGSTGTTATNTPTNNIQVANQQNAIDQTQILDDKTRNLEKLKSDVQQIMNGTFPLSPDQQALVNSVQQSLDRQKKSVSGAMAMEAARGGQEYTPGQMASNLAARVVDMDNAAAGTMASLKQGFMKQDYDMINSAYDKQTKYLDDKANTIQKLHETVLAIEKEKREQQQKVVESINKIAEEAAKGGATLQEVNAIINAKSVGDAINFAGNKLQAGTGIVGEYAFYKKDAQARGITPLSFDEYQTRDANRKASIAKAGTGTGLTTQQNAVVNSTVSSFESNPIVKDFVTIQSKYMNVLNTIGRGDGATDISMIYDFMKALDPTSVVRETEYATGAEKSGNIFAGKLAKFNGLINPQGGFISPTAKENIIGAMEQRFNTAKSQYENIRKEKIRTLNSRGVPDGDAYIPQYDYNQSLGKQINDKQQDSEVQAEAKVTEYGDNHPEVRTTIIKLRNDGRTMQEIYNWINQQVNQ